MKDRDSVTISIQHEDKQEITGENTPTLLGYSLTALSSTAAFIACSFAVFFFYGVYGYMLELVFHVEGIRPHGWFITFIQFFYYSLFALVQLAVRKESIKSKLPASTYSLIALLTVGTMGFSNSSMGYLNYPTQVIFKSCKLIPVMIGSVVILQKRYTFSQVLACVLMCIGLVWFTLADTSVQPFFNLKGVFLVSMSLCCDAVIGNVQEAAMKSSQESSARLVLYSYGIGFFIIAALLVATGLFLSGGLFVSQHFWELIPPVLVLSLSGFCGVQAVLALVSMYGALTAVTVTTARKSMSILLSFLLFTKPFTIQYLWGGLIVVAGIYLSVLSKQQGASSHPIVLFLDRSYTRIRTGGCILRLLSPSSKLGRHPVTMVVRLWSMLKSRCRHCVGAKPPHQFRFDV